MTLTDTKRPGLDIEEYLGKDRTVQRPSEEIPARESIDSGSDQSHAPIEEEHSGLPQEDRDAYRRMYENAVKPKSHFWRNLRFLGAGLIGAAAIAYFANQWMSSSDTTPLAPADTSSHVIQLPESTKTQPQPFLVPGGPTNMMPGVIASTDTTKKDTATPQMPSYYTSPITQTTPWSMIPPSASAPWTGGMPRAAITPSDKAKPADTTKQDIQMPSYYTSPFASTEPWTMIPKTQTPAKPWSMITQTPAPAVTPAAKSADTANPQIQIPSYYVSPLTPKTEWSMIPQTPWSMIPQPQIKLTSKVAQLGSTENIPIYKLKWGETTGKLEIPPTGTVDPEFSTTKPYKIHVSMGTTMISGHEYGLFNPNSEDFAKKYGYNAIGVNLTKNGKIIAQEINTVGSPVYFNGEDAKAADGFQVMGLKQIGKTNTYEIICSYTDGVLNKSKAQASATIDNYIKDGVKIGSSTLAETYITHRSLGLEGKIVDNDVLASWAIDFKTELADATKVYNTATATGLDHQRSLDYVVDNAQMAAINTRDAAREALRQAGSFGFNINVPKPDKSKLTYFVKCGLTQTDINGVKLYSNDVVLKEVEKVFGYKMAESEMLQLA